jgi:hypothetical protein
MVTDGGASPADGATADAADAGGGCGSLVNVGPEIMLEKVAAAPPTPMGGTIADGTYVSTKFEYYTGDGGATGPVGNGGATLVLNSGTYTEADLGSPMVQGGTYTTSGTTYQRTQTCPTGHSFTWEYTSDGTSTLLLIRPPGSDPGVPAGQTIVETWTKQ